MRKLLYLLFTLALLSGCSKDPAPEPSGPTPQTVVMYLPWAGSGLYNAFINNIERAKEAIAGNILGQSRLLVFMQTNSTQGTLRELYYQNGKCEERTLKSYTGLNVTQKEVITGILKDVKEFAPAERYGITVGAHGMGWIPAQSNALKALKSTPGQAPQKEYWEYISEEGIFTRWFGDASSLNTNTTTFAQAIAEAEIHFEYILFDVCFMSSIEVAYELRNAASYIVASPCEILSVGFPYNKTLPYLFTQSGRNYDLEGVCRTYKEFFSTYHAPTANSGAIAMTNCSELEALAAIMKRINTSCPPYTPNPANPLQVYDTYSPTLFFDYGDYVRQICNDPGLLQEFEAQIERTMPSSFRLHTGNFYSAGRKNPIDSQAYTGITTSDPSTSSTVTPCRSSTEWYAATH